MQAAGDASGSAPQAATAMDDDRVGWIEVPPWAHRWKRMVLMMGVSMMHALTGVIVQTLEVIRERQAAEALETYLKYASSADRAKLNPPAKKTLGTNRPMAKGKALSRSKTQKWQMEPEDCPHTQMSNPRGGRGETFWWTCLQCGSRWERVHSESSGSAPTEPAPKAAATPVSTTATESEFEMVSPKGTKVTKPVWDRMFSTYQMYRDQNLDHMQATRQLMLQAETEDQQTMVFEFIQSITPPPVGLFSGPS